MAHDTEAFYYKQFKVGEDGVIRCSSGWPYEVNKQIDASAGPMRVVPVSGLEKAKMETDGKKYNVIHRVEVKEFIGPDHKKYDPGLPRAKKLIVREVVYP